MLLSNRQKTIRFWLRIIYALACLSLAVTVISLNYKGCDGITGIRRGIGAGTIIFWFIFLRHIIHHQVLELELIYRPGTRLGREAEHGMEQIHGLNLIGVFMLLLFNLPVMLHYKLYDPFVPVECTSRQGYNTLLALLVLNSIPAGMNILMALSTTILALLTVFIRWVGFWFMNYSINYTAHLVTYFGNGRNRHQQSAGALPNTNTNTNPVILDIELSTQTEELPANNNDTELPSNLDTTSNNQPSTSPLSPATPSITQSPKIECPVCLEDKQIYIKMKCGHNLCLGCASNWFSENQSCPICRNQISQPISSSSQSAHIPT
jgi:hypothetical protein